MHIHLKYIVPVFFGMAIGLCLLSCKKMVTVPPPVNTITTVEIFKDDAQAATAMAGVYTLMVNKALNFSNGYATIMGGMSSDELFYFSTNDAGLTNLSSNTVLNNNFYTSTIWTNIYKTIYNANAVIDGIEQSTSESLRDSTRKRLTAEAKFVRALHYFYLANLFGDVPLALTIDFNKTRNMTRTPVSEVYQQVVQDLKDAQSILGTDYPAAGKILPNKWVATALLARVYLYLGDNANAASQATAIISNTSLFSLESDPNNVFLVGSKEAIWQMKQGTTDNPYKNSTIEGYTIIPSILPNGIPRYCLTPTLLGAFETGDRRRTAWVNSTTNSGTGLYYYPYKYKIGTSNSTNNPSTEYYMMLRLAEMYLIRAEAEANGATGGVAAAITDVNVLRARAGLTALSASLNQAQVISAIARERQVELFAEWGHRWLDLKRTGKAHDVLSAIAGKQPWAGDYQLLYPIPPSEIQVNPRLLQNDGY